MASITGVNSYLYETLFSGTSSLYQTQSSLPVINTSTEKFKGNVTGYKPIQKTSSGQYTSALSSEDTKAYMSALKSFGSKLKSATANVSNSGQSVFSKVTGASSKDEALTVSVSKQADAAQFLNAKGTKNITIQQLATVQKNTGTSLASTALSGANTGTNSFSVEKDGKTYQFSVNIYATDSTRTAQQKTADAINKQNIGINASVEYDSKTKKSTLVLASTETGEKNAFTIADVENKGNLVSALGIGQTTQAAGDARYTVDGVEKTSAKNTVDLGDGLTGTLKKVTSEEVKVTAKKDITGITNAIYDVVNNFNGLRETAKDYGNDQGAQSLLQRMDNLASSYSSSLEKLGITRNKDGYLEIDTKKLTKAFEDGSAERYLGDNNAGFTQRLSQLAKTVDSDPNRYVSYQSRRSMNDASQGANGTDNTSYTNYMSAYQSTQLSTIGLLFSSGV